MKRILTLVCRDGHAYTDVDFDDELETEIEAAYRLGGKASRKSQAEGQRGFPVCPVCGHRDFSIRGLPRE